MAGCLVGGFVIAGATAGFAVHEAVGADADIELGLAEAAEFIAFALRLGHFALAATAFTAAGSGGHSNKVAPGGGGGNMPLVTSMIQLLISDFLIAD